MVCSWGFTAVDEDDDVFHRFGGLTGGAGMLRFVAIYVFPVISHLLSTV